ncbi:MAG: HlyC/CorC family transporter [Hyphomicrobiaceae bacterium]|nr:HlyC/CorC family transporter [Hyphomicrobiaceae bacterium]
MSAIFTDTVLVFGGAILLLLILSAFFSGSETALTAVSRARMHARQTSGDKAAGIVLKLTDMRERLIGALLLGNNLVNILASSLATSLFLSLFGEGGVAIATLVMTALVLIFSEVLPKTLAITDPERFALGVAGPVRFIVAIFGPVTAAVQFIIRLVLRLFGRDIDADRAVLSAHEEIRGQLDLLHMEGSVGKGDRDRLGGVLDLHELEVSDVMIHRTKMHMISIDLPADKIVDEVLASPYSRLPVFKDTSDNIVGVIHVKDLLRQIHATGGDFDKLDVMAVASTPWFVPDTTPLQAQLNAFLKRKAHIALVVDEYGEVQGLITLEDILEEIVGDIADEHDVVVDGVRPGADGSLLVEGTVPIRDLNRAFDWRLPDEEATTVAGLVIHEARQIPSPGQAFTFHGFRFEVMRRQRNRLTQVKVTPLKTARPGKAEA